MSIKMSKRGTILFLLALFLTPFIIMNDYVIIPVAADLYAAFPDHESIVNFILSGPQILGVIGALLCGRMTKTNQKKIIVVAFSVFALTSIFCTAILSPIFMAAMRAVQGVAMGFVNTASVTLLAEVFVDENLRGTYMGIYNAAMAGLGAIMSYAAGILAKNHWTSVFKVYYATIPMLIIFILFLPGNTQSAEEDEVQAASAKSDKKLDGRYWLFIFSLFMFVLTYMVISYMVSVYITENNLGDSSVAGLATSLSTVLSAIMCAIFGFTYGKMKRWIAVPSWIILAIFYALMVIAPSTAMVYIASALMGGAFGNAFSWYYVECTLIVPEDKIGFSVSIVTAVQGLAMGVASYFALMKIMHTERITPIFVVLAIISVIGTVYSVVHAYSLRKEQV